MNAGSQQPLGYLLYRVAAALRSELVSTVLEPLGLSFPEYICLRMVSQSPGKTNAELARDAGVSPQAMNTVLRGLVRRGLVSRPDTVASGRSLPAKLTGRGAALLTDIDSGTPQAEERVLSVLDAQDRRDFRRILTALG
ncbi:MarR family winged helix-turn-helix transcriptional regulator [Mycolicibacterium palauense]|uniref:MarR family winged helix-turn-helix transcriptional regulator n=1 Tax=Mycolicibacterium palauense TaxID=2034511 RepID=UPI000BFEAD51|nr:MarR family transcriptional regulator [Mycolicibacterium palauense]